MPRYVLEIMYDGTQFHGSQIQGELPTVQLSLNKTLSILFKTDIPTVGASRTDDGVHALCNFYHFDIETSIVPELKYKMNAILPSGIAVNNIYKAIDPEFNARFEAVQRSYRYRVYRAKDPFMDKRGFFYPYALDEDVLIKTAEVIKQHSQFESFCKRNAQSHTHFCTIYDSYWLKKKNELQYVVTANRFLRGMVRGLVATQIHIARGKGTLGDLEKIFAARDCTKAYFNVPGHGLYLEHIIYPEGTLELI